MGGAVAQYASADQSPRKAVRTADPLAAVLAAGARVVGRTTTEELHLGLLAREGAALNPAAPDATASGTGAGAAMAVAAGLADFALGVDHLAGLRVRLALRAPLLCEVPAQRCRCGCCSARADPLLRQQHLQEL